MMAYEYGFTHTSLKLFQKLPHNIQQRIVSKLDYYCSQPSPLAYATKLTHHESGTYRFRIGTYRVIFDVVNSDTLLILDIGHRRSIYR
jgi:mRNA interferase RelE/StbE